jgi:uncharacterized membrane protein
MEYLDILATYIMGMPFLIGVIFLITALIMYFFPPKSINHFYGYRTSTSMKSQEVWDFAQRYSSVKLMQSAVLLMLFAGCKSILNLTENQEVTFGLISTTILVLFLFFSVENAIKKNFPNP